MLPIPNRRTAYWNHWNNAWSEYEDEPVGDALKRGAWYFVPNELGEARNKAGHLRDKRNVIGFNAFFLDFDAGSKEEQMQTIRTMPLRPTAIVESGRGYHAYFAIEDGSKINATIWSAVQSQMARTHGADKAVRDPARLMRLPGSWHTKNGSELKEVTIVEYHDGVFYGVREIMEVYPVPQEQVRTYTLGRIKEVPSPREGILLREGERHAGLLREAGSLYGRVSEAAWGSVRDVLKGWYSRSCVKLKDNWEKEVDDICTYIEYAERSKR